MQNNNHATLIGESIHIQGRIAGDENLTVQGRIDGHIELTQILTIEETGVVKANVSVQGAVISGVLVGNIVATDFVQITPTGRLVGDIQAPRVIIVAGARVRGNVDMGDALENSTHATQTQQTPVAAIVRTEQPASRPQNHAARQPLPPMPSTLQKNIATQPLAVRTAIMEEESVQLAGVLESAAAKNPRKKIVVRRRA